MSGRATSPGHGRELHPAAGRAARGAGGGGGRVGGARRRANRLRRRRLRGDHRRRVRRGRADGPDRLRQPRRCDLRRWVRRHQACSPALSGSCRGTGRRPDPGLVRRRPGDAGPGRRAAETWTRSPSCRRRSGLAGCTPTARRSRCTAATSCARRTSGVTTSCSATPAVHAAFAAGRARARLAPTPVPRSEVPDHRPRRLVRTARLVPDGLDRRARRPVSDHGRSD